jgi:Cft2 family RNA processing exonuclease
MNAGVAASPIRKSWRELYKAAVFETDKNRVSERIAHAEWALALRARELFHTGREHLQERQAVDAAIYALHALRRTTACAAGQNRKDGGKAA